jgi:hypothetical protein
MTGSNNGRRNLALDQPNKDLSISYHASLQKAEDQTPSSAKPEANQSQVGASAWHAGLTAAVKRLAMDPEARAKMEAHLP